MELLAEQLNRETGLEVARSVHGSYGREAHEDLIGEIKLGNVKIVFSTSVWLQGIDIPGMSAVMFLSVPNVPGNFQQGSGRVGRSKAGLVLAIAPANEFGSRGTTFKHFYEYRISRPEIHLDDPRIQIVNALCLEKVARLLGLDVDSLNINQARYNWPKGLSNDGDLKTILERLRRGRILTDTAFARRLVQHRRTPHSIFGGIRRLAPRSGEFQLVVSTNEGEKVIGKIDRRRAVRELGPGMIYRQSGRYRVDDWQHPTKDHREWRIVMRPTGHVGRTISLLEKYVNIDIASHRIMPRRISGKHGSMVEHPLQVTERYIGYYYGKGEGQEDAKLLKPRSGGQNNGPDVTPQADGGAQGSPKLLAVPADGQKDEGRGSPYVDRTDTSGIVFEFDNMKLDAQELSHLARFIHESFCRVTHLSPQDVSIAHKRIYRGNNFDGSSAEVASSLVIYDSSSDGLRVTRGLMDNIHAVVESMIEMHGDEPVVQKFLDFVTTLRGVEPQAEIKELVVPTGVGADFDAAAPSGTTHNAAVGKPNGHDHTNGSGGGVFLPNTPVWYTPPPAPDSTETPTPVPAVVDSFTRMGDTLVYYLRPHHLTTPPQMEVFRRQSINPKAKTKGDIRITAPAHRVSLEGPTS